MSVTSHSPICVAWHTLKVHPSLCVLQVLSKAQLKFTVTVSDAPNLSPDRQLLQLLPLVHATPHMPHT